MLWEDSGCTVLGFTWATKFTVGMVQNDITKDAAFYYLRLYHMALAASLSTVFSLSLSFIFFLAKRTNWFVHSGPQRKVVLHQMLHQILYKGDFGMGFAISWAKLHYYILIIFYFIFFLPFISLITFQLNLCCDMKLAVSTNFTWFESSSLSLAPYSSLNFFPFAL